MTTLKHSQMAGIRIDKNLYSDYLKLSKDIGQPVYTLIESALSVWYEAFKTARDLSLEDRVKLLDKAYKDYLKASSKYQASKKILKKK